jgi:hypothetical protein
MLTKGFKLGVSWILLCVALATHILDEAITGFLSVYNPTIVAIRERVPWFRMPVFDFNVWLTGLIVANVLLVCLSPFMFAQVLWMRPVAYALAIIMIANGLGHTFGTVLGHTVQSVRFQRPMPGFYSSPGLVAASIFLLVQLKNTRHSGTSRSMTKSRKDPSDA